jgi:hypothetical protein
MSLENISLEQRDELALLMKQLAENPETRKDALRLTKKLRPDLPMPELEIEDYTEKKVSQAQKRVEDLEAKLREKEIREELKEKRDALIKKGLIDNESDIEEVEKVMLENKIADHETAAQYWQWMKQAAAPTPTGYNPNPVAKFDLGKYYKNPQQAARDEAAKALSDLRNTRKPIGI